MTIEYMAGFFDGEGSVMISKLGYLIIGVANINRKIMESIAQTFGGYLDVQEYRKGNRKIAYYWKQTGTKAASTLEKLLPYLKQKRGAACLAIAYQKWKTENPLTIRDPKRKQEIQKTRDTMRALVQKMNDQGGTPWLPPPTSKENVALNPWHLTSQ
jgi:hypothetical protein